MRTVFIAVVILLATSIASACAFFGGNKQAVTSTASSIFDISVPSISGTPVQLSTFKGKNAYLCVNVASK